MRFHNNYKVEGPGVFTGRSGTIGKVFYVEENYWPHNTSLWVTDFYDNHPKFIYYFYSNLRLEKFLAGTGVPTLNRNDVHITRKAIPESIPEQRRIAEILSTWDKAIELKAKLLEQKKLQKKGLMQQLLTGKLRTINPETGKPYGGEWEGVKIGDVIEFMKKESIPDPQNYKLLTVKLHLKGIEFTNSKPKLTKNGRPYYFRDSGEILIGRQNLHNGGIGIMTKSEEPYIASNAISSLKAKNNQNIFFFLYFSNPNFYRKIGHIIGGTGQKEISESMLKKYKITIPRDKKEQQTIASILTEADQEIVLQEIEIEHLKEQKRGLMQLLLTGVVRVK